jgi:serine acetyltransferase
MAVGFEHQVGARCVVTRDLTESSQSANEDSIITATDKKNHNLRGLLVQDHSCFFPAI